MDFMIRRP